MKKLLTLTLAAILLLGLAACGKSDTASTESEPTLASTSFVKPKNYATVLSVTINPQFRLYLDAEGRVLAVEAVNKDAETIIDKISFENSGYEEVIENIITVSNESGFVKENADIKLEISETKVTVNASAEVGAESPENADNTAEVTERKNEILTKAEAAANRVATDLNVIITVSAVGKDDTEKTENTKTEADVAPAPEQIPAHQHHFAEATCTVPAKCACGAAEGKALGHSFNNGVCTRCSAKDPNYLTPCANKNGHWLLATVSGDSVVVIKLTMKDAQCGLSFNRGLRYDSIDTSKFTDEKQCETVNGVKYYYVAGDGDQFNFSEDGKTVKLGDFTSNESVAFTLSRTGENTLKVTGADNVPEWLSTIKVGAVFDFIAE